MESQDIVLAEPGATYKTSRVPKPVFGSGKGTFGKMADDFDELLKEMKEYI